MSDDDINLPPLPRVQVPLIEADVSLLDIRVLARWCERIATDHARAAVLADRARRELLAERDELAKDAARYRWLRDPCSGAERVIFYCRGDYGRGLMSSTMLDAAIDAAMQRTSGGER